MTQDLYCPACGHRSRKETSENGILALLSLDGLYRAIWFPAGQRIEIEELPFPFAMRGRRVGIFTQPVEFAREWAAVDRTTKRSVAVASRLFHQT